MGLSVQYIFPINGKTFLIRSEDSPQKLAIDFSVQYFLHHTSNWHFLASVHIGTLGNFSRSRPIEKFFPHSAKKVCGVLEWELQYPEDNCVWGPLFLIFHVKTNTRVFYNILVKYLAIICFGEWLYYLTWISGSQKGPCSCNKAEKRMVGRIPYGKWMHFSNRPGPSSHSHYYWPGRSSKLEEHTCKFEREK